MEKRGKSQANLIAVVLVILIVIVAVVIVWNIVMPLVREKSNEAQIGQFSIGLEITGVDVFETGATKITVKRGAGSGEVNNLKFIFYDEAGNSKTETAGGLGELETRIYSFSPVGIGKINKISVVPVIGSNFGMESRAETNNILKVPSGVARWKKLDNKTNTFLDYYSDNSLSFTKQMAVSFWVKSSGNIKGTNYRIKSENNKVNFSYLGGSFEAANDMKERWNHVVVSLDMNNLGNNSRIYINDMPEILSVDELTLDSALNLSGELDNVMLFNKPLSIPEVHGIYVSQKK